MGGGKFTHQRLLLILAERLNRFSCGLKRSTQKSIRDWMYANRKFRLLSPFNMASKPEVVWFSSLGLSNAFRHVRATICPSSTVEMTLNVKSWQCGSSDYPDILRYNIGRHLKLKMSATKSEVEITQESFPLLVFVAEFLGSWCRLMSDNVGAVGHSRNVGVTVDI